jgi:multisubunit Na+/H+ antiporter MnhB subunit
MPSHRPNLILQTVRLPRGHRWAVYGVVGLLMLSGSAWLMAHHFLRSESEFGPSIHPLEPWSIKLHGLATFLFLSLAGSLWTVHMRLAWRQGRNLLSAIILLVWSAILTMTGYLLYYGPGDEVREWISWLHWIVGLALPLVLMMHVWIGRKIHNSIRF